MKRLRSLSLVLVLCLLTMDTSFAEADFPVVLTDAAGREITIEEAPETLVSGYYIGTSVLIALGLADRLVGIEAKANSRPIYALAAPELLELPDVGTAKDFNFEACLALNPDLVVLPLRLRDAAETLKELDVDVLLVNPESLEALKETVQLLAAATGTNGDALLDDYRAKEEFLTRLLADVERPTVYLAGNSSYLSTAGAAMYQNALIELGGGINVAKELTDSYWQEISYEQLLSWNPDVIVIAADADYTREDLLADEQLQNLTAVKGGRVYALPSSIEAWDSPVPGALLGSLWMASVLHEALYPREQFCSDAAEFYAQFYGFGVDAALLTK